MNKSLNIRKIYSKLPPKLRSKIWRSKRWIKNVTRRKETEIPAFELDNFRARKDEMNVVFDVGARTDLSFYNIKSDCEYHLFEPNKKFVKSLCKQVSKLKEPHKIFINAYGLSDITDDKHIYYRDSQSFVINPVMGSNHIGDYYPLKTLDTYVEENNINKIDFLKVDAEGMDHLVFKGGVKTLKDKVKYLQFEYWNGIRKFADMLTDFDLYLMMDPRLRVVALRLSNNDEKYMADFIKVDEELIRFIDTVLIPNRSGGNVFGVRK